MKNADFPHAIRLGRLAIAAGLAGYSVSLVYHGFAAPLLAEVWKHHAQEVGEKEAIYIANRGHLRQLTLHDKALATQSTSDNKAAASPKLFFIRTAQLLNEMAWAAGLCRVGAADKTMIRPVVFAITGANDDGDAPGARLDLYASPAAEQKIISWLQQVKKDETVRLPMLHTAVEVNFPEAIDKLCWPTPPGSDAAGIFRLRDCQVFRALLAGACVLRHLDCGRPPTAVTILTVSADDYETVHTLLQSRLVRPADELYDPLAAAMVARANEYLKMRHDQGQSRKPGRADGDSSSYHPRKLTRNDLCDLGEPNSQANRHLITFLLKDEKKGFSRFRELGLVRQLSKEEGWPGPNTVKKLAPLLRSWSYKQVRTHFGRLLKGGLIEGTKEQNGPWVYNLPEDLGAGRSAFCRLPTPTTLRAELVTTDHVPESKVGCPACPSPAQPGGQPEVQQEPTVTSQNGVITTISTN